MTESPARSVYVLHGQDEYMRRRRRREIVRLLTGEARTDLTVTNFDASAELSDVLDELRTAPFLAPRRVVLVDAADKFVIRHADSLERYLATPAPTGVLILLTDSWPPKAPAGKDEKDTRDSLARLDRIVRKAGELTACRGPSSASLPRWIAESAKAQGKRIAGQAAHLLVEVVGDDLARLDGEIRKLILYVGPREEISAEDVSALAVAGAGVKPFALTNAIARRDAPRALTALSAMLTRRGEEIRTLGLIAWHLRRSGPKPGAAGPALRRAQRAFRRLLAADLALKTGADPLTTMQLLVINLCV